LVHEYNGVDQAKIKCLKREIDGLKQLDHENIITYYGGEMIENNVFCIYLEYMPLGSISDQCKMYGRLGETICRAYTIQVLKGIAYLHSQNIIHGDLKGANVLLTNEGKEIKLCDLGNSRLVNNATGSQS
jgi:serine/threonine protein kinase